MPLWTAPIVPQLFQVCQDECVHETHEKQLQWTYPNTVSNARPRHISYLGPESQSGVAPQPLWPGPGPGLEP